MPPAQNARISLRKQPQQARSGDLVTAILQAAVQVLQVEGARRFTTARVAERAGVSVGSLYQYFPNKAAILFRLQADEWRETSAMMRAVLEDGAYTPAQRLRHLAHVFLRSECEEAAVRIALDDAAPLYRDAPEAREVKASGRQVFQTFLRAALPHLPEDRLGMAAELISTTLGDGGKRFSALPRSDAEIAAHADAMADMLVAYLAWLAGLSGAATIT